MTDIDEDVLEAARQTRCTADKYRSQFTVVKRMRVKSKRTLFYIMRSSNINENVFLPAFGLFCGEFAVFQIICEHARKDSKK
jgi:hypothetical protein